MLYHFKVQSVAHIMLHLCDSVCDLSFIENLHICCSKFA